VRTAPWIRVLVEGRAVEAAEREVVVREVGGHPVDDHPDPAVVEGLDHRREVVGVAEARGRRVVPGDLVAPRAVERMLGHGEELDVREPEGAAVRDELLGRLTVAEPCPVLVPHPRSEMDLVDGHRRPIRIALRAGAHPLAVRPRVRRWVPNSRRRLGPDLHREREGVGLEPQRAVAAQDLELVELAHADARDEELPDAGAPHRPHREQTAVPAVEVAHDPDAPCVRCPDREADASDALVGPRMRPEDLVEPLVRSLADEVEVDLADRRREPIGIVALPRVPVGEREPDAVVDLVRVHARYEDGPAPVADRFHRGDGTVPPDELGRPRVRMKGPDDRAARDRMRAEDRVRVVVLATRELRELRLGGGGDR
jgi:pyruvate/2-oxoglutarate dehydrogenase complex dihydrolipoamide acyltransferase (E2) component